MRRAAVMALGLWALCAATAAAAEFEHDPERVVLGRTARVVVTLDLGAVEDDEIRPLHLSVNVGEFDRPERIGPGRFRAVYRPPSTRFPQVALVAAWRDAGDVPARLYRLELHGITRVPVKTAPGAEVQVRVGDRVFGPVVAGTDGQVTVPIEVAPGVGTAHVRVTQDERTTENDVPLEVPQYNRLVAAAVPPAIVLDGRATARIEVFYDVEGTPPPLARLVARSSTAEVTPLSQDGRRYSFRLRPAPSARGVARVQVSVPGDSAANAEAEVTLGLAAPARVQVRVPRAPAGGEVDVEALVLGRDGLGISGHLVSVQVAGRDQGLMKDMGGGTYRLRMPVPPDFAQAPRVVATVTSATPVLSGEAPLRVGAQTRRRPRWVAVGVRAGGAFASTTPAGWRAGLDVWVPLRLGKLPLGVGLTADYGFTTEEVGWLGTTRHVEGHWFPVGLRAGLDLPMPLGLSAQAGAVFVAGYGRLVSSPGGLFTGWGAGAGGFVTAGWELGPGQLTAEAAWTQAPVGVGHFNGQLGGFAGFAGYRLWL